MPVESLAGSERVRRHRPASARTKRFGWDGGKKYPNCTLFPQTMLTLLLALALYSKEPGSGSRHARQVSTSVTGALPHFAVGTGWTHGFSSNSVWGFQCQHFSFGSLPRRFSGSAHRLMSTAFGCPIRHAFRQPLNHLIPSLKSRSRRSGGVFSGFEAPSGSS